VSAAKILDLPVLVTTQYAARLGTTVSEISDNLADAKDVKVFDKTLFSMVTPEVEDYLRTPAMQSRTSVLLCGIETHVCVLQTALDLLDRGYDVHILADAVSSSTSFTRSVGLEVG
jgi:nicotinamidase-related amidase